MAEAVGIRMGEEAGTHTEGADVTLMEGTVVAEIHTAEVVEVGIRTAGVGMTAGVVVTGIATEEATATEAATEEVEVVIEEADLGELLLRFFIILIPTKFDIDRNWC